MDPYEKIIKTIRQESGRNKKKQLCIAEMTGTDTCIANGNDLDSDDFRVSEFLVGNLKKGDEVLACKINDEYILISKVVKL